MYREGDIIQQQAVAQDMTTVDLSRTHTTRAVEAGADEYGLPCDTHSVMGDANEKGGSVFCCEIPRKMMRNSVRQTQREKESARHLTTRMVRLSHAKHEYIPPPLPPGCMYRIWLKSRGRTVYMLDVAATTASLACGLLRAWLHAWLATNYFTERL